MTVARCLNTVRQVRCKFHDHLDSSVPPGCGDRAAPGSLGGVTRLDVPGSADQLSTNRPVADSLVARLADLPPNHPSSNRYARSEQPQLREAASEARSEAEISADARLVQPERKPQPGDNSASTREKPRSGTEGRAGSDGPADTVRTGE